MQGASCRVQGERVLDLSAVALPAIFVSLKFRKGIVCRQGEGGEKNYSLIFNLGKYDFYES
jgi:hypothetical protein